MVFDPEDNPSTAHLSRFPKGSIEGQPHPSRVHGKDRGDCVARLPLGRHGRLSIMATRGSTTHNLARKHPDDNLLKPRDEFLEWPINRRFDHWPIPIDLLIER